MESKEKKLDRRVIKSKAAIRKAFITLLTKKDITDISVKEVAELADVDRKTIYNYYAGTYAILDKIEDEITADFKSRMTVNEIEINIENPIKIFDTFNEIIRERYDLYSQIMLLENNRQLTSKLYEVLSDSILVGLDKFSTTGLDKEMVAAFITAGIINTYQKWFLSDKKTPLQQVSKQLGKLVATGINSFKI